MKMPAESGTGWSKPCGAVSRQMRITLRLLLGVIDQMMGKESEAAELLAASGGSDMSLRHNRPGSTTQYGG